MEMASIQPKGIGFAEPQRKLKAERRPHFPRKPLDREDAFIDPQKEAKLFLPQIQQEEAFLALETAVQASYYYAPKSEEKSKTIMHLIYEHLSALLLYLKSRLLSRRWQRKARLTAKGRQALEQLRYLALLCDATELREPEEVLAAESAFGQAYHEIMRLSSELVRMAEQEKPHHIKHYERHFASLLKSNEAEMRA